MKYYNIPRYTTVFTTTYQFTVVYTIKLQYGIHKVFHLLQYTTFTIVNAHHYVFSSIYHLVKNVGDGEPDDL